MCDCNKWKNISEAPRDGTPVDLWAHGKRHTNYRRVERSIDNVFYDPIVSGEICIRDATHFQFLPTPPAEV